MKGHDFKRWRKSLSLSQREAADQLGLKRRVVQYYEKGERDGQSVKIPRTVRLACYALSIGVPDYQGPEKIKEPEKVKTKDRGKDSDKAEGKKPAKKNKAAKSKASKAGDKPKVRETMRERDRDEERSRDWVVAAGVSTKGSKKQTALGKAAKGRAKSPGRGNGHGGPTDDTLD